MENLLQGIPGVCVYIDDIFVTGSTEDEHLDHLTEVLNRLQHAGMRLKKTKCAFLLPQVDYLGHTISAEGLRTSDAKVSGIVNAPAPKNVTELRLFLGLLWNVSTRSGYYAVSIVPTTAKEKEVVMGFEPKESISRSEGSSTVLTSTGTL